MDNITPDYDGKGVPICARARCPVFTQPFVALMGRSVSECAESRRLLPGNAICYPAVAAMIERMEKARMALLGHIKIVEDAPYQGSRHDVLRSIAKMLEVE